MRRSSESRGDGIRAPDCATRTGRIALMHRDGGNIVRRFTRIAVGVVTVAALATPLLASSARAQTDTTSSSKGTTLKLISRLREGGRVTARPTAVRRRCPDGDQGPEEEGHHRRLRAHPRVGRGRRPGGDGLPRGRSEESRRLDGADCQPAVRDLAEGRRRRASRPSRSRRPVRASSRVRRAVTTSSWYDRSTTPPRRSSPNTRARSRSSRRSASSRSTSRSAPTPRSWRRRKPRSTRDARSSRRRRTGSPTPTSRSRCSRSRTRASTASSRSTIRTRSACSSSRCRTTG